MCSPLATLSRPRKNFAPGPFDSRFDFSKQTSTDKKRGESSEGKGVRGEIWMERSFKRVGYLLSISQLGVRVPRRINSAVHSNGREIVDRLILDINLRKD